MAYEGIPSEIDENAGKGAAFKGVARSEQRMPLAIAIAAIAVVGVAVLTRGPSAPVSSGTDITTPQPGTTAAVRSSPPAVGVAVSPNPGPPDRNPAVTPRTTIPPIPAEVGANRLIPAGETPVRLTVSLPAGWTKVTDSTFARSTGSGPASASISAWSVMHVNVFPCRWSANVFADADLMRSARGQAQALASWWGQDPGMPANSNAAIAPLATKPERTTLAGYPAWHVEVLIPTGLDLAECDGGQLVLWHAATGEARRSHGPGELSSLWVVDVAGEAIVVDASTFPAGASDYAGELEATIASIAIERQ